MAKAKGSPKTGGRKPGSRNKSSIPIEELCQEHGCSPFEILIKLTQSEEPIMQFQAAKELAQYLLPKKRALDIDSTINLELAKQAEEFGNLPKKEKIIAMKAELKRLEESD